MISDGMLTPVVLKEIRLLIDAVRGHRDSLLTGEHEKEHTELIGFIGKAKMLEQSIEWMTK